MPKRVEPPAMADRAMPDGPILVLARNLVYEYIDGQEILRPITHADDGRLVDAPCKHCGKKDGTTRLVILKSAMPFCDDCWNTLFGRFPKGER